MNIQELIPKNKFDGSGIEELKSLSFEQIKPIIPDLLEWLQDMNWPVASSIASILKPFINRITAELVMILKSDDVMWKYGVLISLIRNTRDLIILKELERIVKYPTKDEIENEVDLEAIAILNGGYK